MGIANIILGPEKTHKHIHFTCDIQKRQWQYFRPLEDYGKVMNEVLHTLQDAALSPVLKNIFQLILCYKHRHCSKLSNRVLHSLESHNLFSLSKRNDQIDLIIICKYTQREKISDGRLFDLEDKRILNYNSK